MRLRRGVILALLAVVILGGCEWFLGSTDSGGDPPSRYSVTYEPNGATSGAVPVDGTVYAAGATVAVLGNTGALLRGGYSFVGWNTEANGAGTAYTTGATFTMPGLNVTLFAAWEAPFGSSIVRVSVADNGVEGNGDSTRSALSADGRYVAFQSSASNLVSGDTVGQIDIFVYDRQTETVERVSVDNSGAEGNGQSATPSISADGRYVAFRSLATNLVSGDTNATVDVFVHDLQTNTTERVSVDDGGTEGNGQSDDPSISGDGRYVAFHSAATNLVSGDTNALFDVFVYDLQTNTIERVSVDGSGGESAGGGSLQPSISGDGRYVAFQSSATNLVPGDTNGRTDIFVFDRDTDTIERVSVDAGGAEGDRNSVEPSISSDGRYVTFASEAANLVTGDSNSRGDIFVYDRVTDTIERVSLASNGAEANDGSERPSISSDGRYVAFESSASNLVAGDTNGLIDVFVYDRVTDTIERVNVADGGSEGDDEGNAPTLSGDGSQVVFHSFATNLVSGDTNGFTDVFAVPVF